MLLTRVAELLRTLNTDMMTELIGSISSGAAISQGHVPVLDASKVPDGTSHVPKERPYKPAGTQEKSPKIADQDPVERKSLIHIDVVDNAGKAREFSKQQLGIRLCLDDLRGSGAHFKWEPEYSLLVINRRHPDYATCKGDPSRKQQYLETIVKIALPMLLIAEEADGYSQAREALVKLLLYEVINPTRTRGRLKSK
mgnify:FL=1